MRFNKTERKMENTRPHKYESSFIRSLIHSLTHLLTHSLTHARLYIYMRTEYSPSIRALSRYLECIWLLRERYDIVPSTKALKSTPEKAAAQASSFLPRSFARNPPRPSLLLLLFTTTNYYTVVRVKRRNPVDLIKNDWLED